MVYYGLGLNVGNLSGGLYLNFMYASIAETLSCALCVALLNRLGRRVLHCLTMLLGGVACVAIVFPVLYGTDSKVPLFHVWNSKSALPHKFGFCSTAISILLVTFSMAMRVHDLQLKYVVY